LDVITADKSNDALTWDLVSSIVTISILISLLGILISPIANIIVFYIVS
jgi:hypothetical protein